MHRSPACQRGGWCRASARLGAAGAPSDSDPPAPPLRKHFELTPRRPQVASGLAWQGHTSPKPDLELGGLRGLAPVPGVRRTAYPLDPPTCPTLRRSRSLPSDPPSCPTRPAPVCFAPSGPARGPPFWAPGPRPASSTPCSAFGVRRFSCSALWGLPRRASSGPLLPSGVWALCSGPLVLTGSRPRGPLSALPRLVSGLPCPRRPSRQQASGTPQRANES